VAATAKKRSKLYDVVEMGSKMKNFAAGI